MSKHMKEERCNKYKLSCYEEESGKRRGREGGRKEGEREGGGEMRGYVLVIYVESTLLGIITVLGQTLQAITM